MSYWKRGKKYKKVSTTGRKRKIGVRNTTDKTASKKNRKRRTKGIVNTTDRSKKGRIVKRHRRYY